MNRGDAPQAVIDLSAAHIRDASSAALDAIETTYAQRGTTVEIIGLDDPRADLHGEPTGEPVRSPARRLPARPAVTRSPAASTPPVQERAERAPPIRSSRPVGTAPCPSGR